MHTLKVVIILVFVFGLSQGSTLRHRPFKKQQPVKVRDDIVKADSTLILTHVLFRHGNRTPELSELYPKDPYYNFTYYPFGNGQLTNAGKQKEYSIGTALRDRYDDFLGKYYIPNTIESRSTDRNRTKMSLLLVLASLYPPRCIEVWNNTLAWQPIPYTYVPEKEDAVLYGISCPTYVKLYKEVQQTPEVLSEFNYYSEQFQYIANNSGLNISTFEDVYNLWFGLSTEEEWGFVLPNWVHNEVQGQKIWPDFITDIAFKQYSIYTKTTDLKKMAAGYLIQKVIQDTEKKIANQTNTKIYLYSAHENNIGQLFETLDLFEYPHVPTYGSYVLIEVHYINRKYGVKFYYQNYNGTAIPKLLKLPACDEFCPLDTFKTLVQEYIPENGLCGN